MSYKKKLDSMTWSFSRLSTYEKCPYAFYLRYIIEELGTGNFYASNGKAMHEVLEGLAKKKIKLADAISVYLDKFDLICETVNPHTMESICDKCVDYLCELELIDEDRYEIIGVEVKLRFKIGKYEFVGYADLILRDKLTGKVILIDHKSSDHFFKKDGTPLANQKENFLSYRHQMYLYCIGIEVEFGFLPDLCIWNHFKDGGKLSKIEFNQDDFLETKEWALSLIKEIYKDKKFSASPEFFRCAKICDFREDCDYLNEE